jgi:hypothetical protein
MPHLYLPSDHSDADLVLAADVAAAVSSFDLYVAWTHDAGPGVAPEVEAVVRERHPAASPVGGRLRALVSGVVALWRHLVSPPAPRAHASAPSGAQRRTSV